MLSRKDLIFPLILASVLLAIPIWFFTKYFNDFLFYRDIGEHGVIAEASLVKKGVLTSSGGIRKIKATHPSDNHQFLVSFNDSSGQLISCQIGVSKNTYDVISRKDKLSVVYLSSNPNKCTLPSSVKSTYIITLSLLIISIVFLLIALGFLYYIYKSFKKPAKAVVLTSDLDLPSDNLACPRCGSQMSEGYMPTVGGVSWRDRDEPIGIPTILNGLRGTTFWVKRPLLHGFHCKSCEIITFKYGKDRSENISF